MTMMTMGQGGREAAPPAGGEPTTAALIVATTILLFLFFIYQVFFSRPRNKGGVTTGQALVNAAVHCCANCGAEGDVSLKVCKSCMLVKYCNAACQKNHWPTHKKECKLRAAQLRDEALFKDPPPKEDCPICFLPMPLKLICCASLPPANISSVPIYDFAKAHKEFATEEIKKYYVCCGKTICRGCDYSFRRSGNVRRCPFCNAEMFNGSDEDVVEEIRKRVDANDAASICLLANGYYCGDIGGQPDRTKAKELYGRAADLSHSEAHDHLADIYRDGGDMKKAKFHYEAAAIAGHEMARYNLGCMEHDAGSMERAHKHWTISASAGHYVAMHNLLVAFNQGLASRNAIDSTLAAYNTSCAEMRSEARDTVIRLETDTL